MVDPVLPSVSASASASANLPGMPIAVDEPSNKRRVYENTKAEINRLLGSNVKSIPYGEALGWTHRAQTLATELGQSDLLIEVADKYLQIVLHATLEIQYWTMLSGGIFPRHRALSVAMVSGAHKLVELRQHLIESGHSLNASLLSIEGHTEQAQSIVEEKMRSDSYYTDTETFDALMTSIDGILHYLRALSTKPFSDFRSDAETLKLIAFSVDRASQLIYRFFPSWSDWDKAQIQCQWANQLIPGIQNDKIFTLGTIDGPRLSLALRLVRNSLAKKNYPKSKLHFDQLKATLREMKAQF